jgi:predicted nucleic acid-binding protein
MNKGKKIMKKETIYIDTSVISAYYDDRAKDRREATTKFWTQILPNYKVYISDITVEELEDTKDEALRKRLLKAIKDFEVLKTNQKIKDLANAYIENDVFPERYFDDALHVAIASFYEISYLVSWNFEHMVKVKTRRLVRLVNALEGFKEIEIVSPPEL